MQLHCFAAALLSFAVALGAPAQTPTAGKAAELPQVQLLVGQLKEPFPDTTMAVTMTLSNTPAGTARMNDPKLMAAAHRQKMAVVFDLVDLGPAAVPELIRALEDGGWAHRAYAAYTLGLLGDARAIEPLRRIMNSKPAAKASPADATGAQPLRSSEAALQQECAIALARLGQPDGLVKAMRDAEWPRSSGGVFIVCPPAFLPSESWSYPTEIEPLLAAVGTPAVDTLIACLKDENEEVRWRAASLLGKIGDRRAVDPLIRLLGDPKVNVVAQAARALGEIGDPRAIDSLLDRLSKGDWPTEAVAKALGQIGDQRAVPGLGEEGLNLNWPTTLAEIHAVDQLGGPQAAAALKRLLGHDLSGSVYYQNVVAAAEALARRGDPDALGILQGVLASRYIDAHDKALAIRALGRIPGLESERLLRQQLATGPEPNRLIAALTLAKRGRQEGFDALPRNLHRWYIVAEDLGEIPDPRAEKILLHILNPEGHQEELVKAQDELTAEGDHNTPSGLLMMARMFAWKSLAKIAGESGLARLRQAMAGNRNGIQPEEQWNRRDIVKALGDAGRTDCRDILVTALRDTSEEVRAAAAEAVGRLKLTDASDLLRATRRDEYWAVRLQAELALRRLGSSPPTEAKVENIKSGEKPATTIAAGHFSAEAPAERTISMWTVETVAKAVRPENFVAVVSFISGSTADDFKVPQSLTKLVPLPVKDLKATDTLLIDGQINVIKTFHLTPPPVGHVSGAFRVYMDSGGDEVFRRLKALFPPNEVERGVPHRVSKTNYALAVGPVGSTDILQATFFGPLDQSDFDSVEQLVAYLLAKRFEQIGRPEAEKLLANDNPWLAVLGLVRLKELRALPPQAFFTVMRHVPAETVPGVFQDISNYRGWLGSVGWPALESDFGPQTVAYLKDADPQRQTAFLKCLISTVRWDGNGLKKTLSGSGAFRAALHDLASQRQGKPEWEKVVSQYHVLESLLATPEKVKP